MNFLRSGTLRTRTTTVFLGTAGLALIFIGAAIWIYQKQLLTSRVEQELRPYAAILGASVGPAVDYDQPDRVTELLAALFLDTHLQLRRADVLLKHGRTLAKFPADSPELDADRWLCPEGVRLEGDVAEFIGVFYSPNGVPGRIVLRMDLKNMEASNRNLLLFTGGVGFLLLLFTGLGQLWVLQRSVVTPLERLAADVERRRTDKDWRQRVSEHGRFEMAQLAKNFNLLLGEVEARESEAAEKNSLLEATLQATADGILVVSESGRITSHNRRLVEMLRLPPETLAAGDTEKLVAFLEHLLSPTARAQQKFGRLNDTSRAETFDELQLVDGRVIERFSRPQTVGSAVAGRVWSFRDVTHERLAEVGLRESEGKFKMLFEAANDAILLMNDRIFLDCNQRAEAMYGCSRGELIGQSPVRFSPREQADGVASATRAVEKIAGAMAGQPQFFEWIHCRADGTPFIAEVSLNRLDLRGELVIQAIVRDITARKQAEAAQREAEELYRTLVNTSPDGICVLDMAGNVRFTSPRNQELFALHHPEAMLGRDFLDFIVPADLERARPLLHRALQGNFDPQQRFQMLRPNGTRFVAELNGTLLRDGLGVPRGLMVITRDVSDRQHQDDELKNKNAELERFTYTVSHDLKSPLITIKGFASAQLADAKAGRTDRLDDDLKRIVAASDKMAQLLNGLLELSRVGRILNQPISVSMTQVAEEVVELLSGTISQNGAQVTVQRAMPIVSGDPQRLAQVLQNLLENALKFSRQTGPPVISIGCKKHLDVDVFFVRDNGPGIEPRHRKSVFGLFNKLDARTEGTGIGLALVRRIVEFHGGHIWVESGADGKGAIFCFTLAGATATSETSKA